MNAHRTLQQLLLVGALAAGIAACGSSGSSGPGASSSPATSAPASSPAAAPATSSGSSATVAAITTNWETFFNAKTPTSKRVALLQDGTAFEPIIKAQNGSGLAASATAKVTKVTVQSATQAKVSYDILLAGQTALAGQSGVAVYQDGTWKVGVASFCGLLTLENNGDTSKLPSACKSAG